MSAPIARKKRCSWGQFSCLLLERLDMDIRDRVATPATWYEPFREATWEEALELAAQEIGRLRDAHGSDSLAVFQSANSVSSQIRV